MKINKGLCFTFLFVMCLCDASRLIVANQKLELSKISTSSNITPVKSIKSPDGDIIDCVEISHQPAFDHPLLKNHTIQMNPSSFPKELFGERKVSTSKNHDVQQIITQLWQLNGSCPDGTIPIRRTTHEDLFIASSIKKKLNSFPQIYKPDRYNHEYAIVTTDGKFYGAKAAINVWNPKVDDKVGMSVAQIWIVSGSGPNVNTIEVGWTVNPTLYGDKSTRLFAYWTRDYYQSTGCYNLLCSGFVQTSKRLALGMAISPLSSYHGAQTDITLVVWKDTIHGYWWLKLGDEIMGYWPASLFTDLADSASRVQWGGEVSSDGPPTIVEMGSGHLPEERFGGAGYFRNLHVVDGSNTLRPPGRFSYDITKPNCYNLIVGNSKVWEDFFFYGGPGKNPNCS